MLRRAIAQEPIPPMVNALTQGWGFVNEANASTIATSTTWETGPTRQVYQPLFVPTTCVARRFFWANGVTVSSANLVQVGIYSDGGGDPYRHIATTGVVPQGTASQVQFAEGGIGMHRITEGADTTDQDTYTTASVTLQKGLLYLLVIGNSKGSSPPTASAQTTGGAVTFTSRSTTTAGSAERLSVFSAVPTADVTDTIDISFGASSGTTACLWMLEEFLNVDTTTNHGVVQQVPATGSGTAASTTLSSFGSSNNATFGAVLAEGGGGQVWGTGFVESPELVTATPTLRMSDAYQTFADTTVDTTLSSGVVWEITGLELKRKADTSLVLTPGLYWLALSCSATAATFFRAQGATTVWGSLFKLQDTLDTSNILPSIATPDPAGTASIWLHGFSTDLVT